MRRSDRKVILTEAYISIRILLSEFRFDILYQSVHGLEIRTIHHKFTIIVATVGHRPDKAIMSRSRTHRHCHALDLGNRIKACHNFHQISTDTIRRSLGRHCIFNYKLVIIKIGEKEVFHFCSGKYNSHKDKDAAYYSRFTPIYHKRQSFAYGPVYARTIYPAFFFRPGTIFRKP